MSTASGDDYLVADPSTMLGSAEFVDSSPAVAAEAPAAQWPFLIVLVVALGGLGVIAAGSLLQGLTAFVVAVGLAALLRLFLPSRTAGWLASRTRAVDVAAFGVLAAALGAVTLLMMG